MYALLNIPAHMTCRNCGECCGVIPANAAEIAAIREYLDEHPDVRALAVKQSGNLTNCPFRNDKKRRCSIYPVRPMICRLCGVSIGKKCKYGNSVEINGYKFLTGHDIDKCVLLNLHDWSKTNG